MNRMKKLYNILLIAVMLFGYGTQLSAQDDAKPKKIRLSLSYTNVNNMGPRLTAKVLARVERSYLGVDSVTVNFYYGEEENMELLGSTVTQENGEALFLVPEVLRKVMDTTDVFVFSAAVENQEGYADRDTDVEILRSKTYLSLVEEDSTRIARFRILGVDDEGEFTPVEGLNPVFYVERLFGMLPISDEFVETDSDGSCEIVFPEDLPGDKDGKLKVIVLIDDHEDYGTLKAVQQINWGVPIVDNGHQNARTLWSTAENAPRPLVITVCSVLLGIFMIVLYIIYSLFKIRSV